MGRLRVEAGWLTTIVLLASPAAFAVSSAVQFEPAMLFSYQLSPPAASEDERDLLRREYRLIQASSEFWLGFDSLNVRIHGTADLLRDMRSLVEGVTPPVRPRTMSLLAGLKAAPVEAAPVAAAVPQTPAKLSRPVAQEEGLDWVLGAAVLGGLTLIWIRRRAAVQADSAPSRRVRAALKTAVVTPVGKPPPAPEVLPEQADDGDDSLRRHTVPTPEAGPPPPVDPVREEMDHALDLAEAMLSYGRTTGAMQTLRDYLHDHPTNSVRPWLKLLDLHRQTGMREDFECAAETVHRHFNVKVPGWDEGISGVPLRSFFDDEESLEIPGLEQLPRIIERVQATWPDASCLEYLSHLLVDNRDGGRVGFPVSVVAEILLLEDILNDRLAGQA